MSGFDKQVLRDWLKTEGVDGKEQLEIPQSVINSTWNKYCEAFELLTGQKFIP
jgi:phosphoribosylaminoimidazole-succinocarboxamide synthase